MVGGVECVQQCLRRFCDGHFTWVHTAINHRNTFVPTWISSVVHTFHGRRSSGVRRSRQSSGVVAEVHGVVGVRVLFVECGVEENTRPAKPSSSQTSDRSVASLLRIITIVVPARIAGAYM